MINIPRYLSGEFIQLNDIFLSFPYHSNNDYCFLVNEIQRYPDFWLIKYETFAFSKNKRLKDLTLLSKGTTKHFGENKWILYARDNKILDLYKSRSGFAKFVERIENV